MPSRRSLCRCERLKLPQSGRDADACAGGTLLEQPRHGLRPGAAQEDSVAVGAAVVRQNIGVCQVHQLAFDGGRLLQAEGVHVEGSSAHLESGAAPVEPVDLELCVLERSPSSLM